MRANISINTYGITQPSVKPAPPDGGATVSRNNQSFVVTIPANPSARARRHWCAHYVRLKPKCNCTAPMGSITVTKRGRNYVFCSRKWHLTSVNSKLPQFTRKIEILSGVLLNIDVLPENLFRLGQLSLGTLYVPTALQRISEVGIENSVSVGQTMSMKLSFIARPDNLIWPSQTPKLGETSEEWLPRAEGEWLATVYEAALAIRRPLYHHGLISIDSKGRQPFQRLIYPLVQAHERSVNHRVLSVVTLNNQPNYQMIYPKPSGQIDRCHEPV